MAEPPRTAQEPEEEEVDEFYGETVPRRQPNAEPSLDEILAMEGDELKRFLRAHPEMIDPAIAATEASPANEHAEGEPPEAPELSDEAFRPTEPTDEMFAHIVQRQAAENEQLLRRLDSGDFETVALDGGRIALLRAQTEGPDSPERGESVQRLHFLLTTAAERTVESAPFVPVAISYRNLGPKGVRTIERDSLGRERVVGEMSREDVDAALEQESHEVENEFGSEPFRLALAEFATWDHGKRRRFAERFPRELDELAEAASRAEP